MAIQLKTTIPGPESQRLMAIRREQVARGPFHTTPVFVQRAHGAVIEDVDGNRLLDFACGIGVTNLGHTPDTVVERSRKQMTEVIHSSFNVVPHASYAEVAEKLNRHVPGSFKKKTLLVNSGAEAVENAVKIARSFTKRANIVCFEHAYHGRTYMAMTLTAKSKPYKATFGPFCSDVYRAAFPDLYRWPTEGLSEAEISDQCFIQFQNLMNFQVNPQETAAVILEPVLGEGGFIPVPKPFIKKVRDFCSQNGIVLIFDEVQTGFGRTGTFFASEQLGVEADLVTTAKALGSGFPIAAVTGRAEIMDAPGEGGIGGTYGGNPVACAAALTVFEAFERGSALQQAQETGRLLKTRLEAWYEKFPVIGNVRGLGPMRAMELVKDRKSKEPNKEAVGKLIRFCYENGLILLSAGTFGNVIRFLVPLTITRDELHEGLDVIEKGLKQL